VKILLAGSISFDYHMRYAGRFRDALLAQSLERFRVSFDVSSMDQHRGGVSANIAYTLALLGGKPLLFGTVGHDFDAYRQHLERVGVDTSTVRVIPDVHTATFFATTDSENNQLGSFYTGAMRYAERYNIMDVVAQAPDLAVISPNAPLAMQNHAAECRCLGIPYIFDPSQQVARLDGDALRDGIAGCMALTCNEYEWEIIALRTGWTLDDLGRMGVVFVHTLGADGANIYHTAGVDHIPAVPPRQIANPTGAGDAFRGGLLRGLSLGMGWALAGRMGALCGTYALEHIGTQGHTFTWAEFAQRFAKHYDTHLSAE